MDHREQIESLFGLLEVAVREPCEPSDRMTARALVTELRRAVQLSEERPSLPPSLEDTLVRQEAVRDADSLRPPKSRSELRRRLAQGDPSVNENTVPGADSVAAPKDMAPDVPPVDHLKGLEHDDNEAAAEDATWD